MGPGYTRGNFMDKKSHYGKKRYQSHGNSQTQIIYAKKAKPLTEVTWFEKFWVYLGWKKQTGKWPWKTHSLRIQEYIKSLWSNILATTTENKESTIQKLPYKLEKAGFFVIKSYSEEDVFKVITYPDFLPSGNKAQFMVQYQRRKRQASQCLRHSQQRISYLLTLQCQFQWPFRWSRPNEITSNLFMQI